MTNIKRTLGTLILGLFTTLAATAADRNLDYQILSTSRTTTMEREMNQAAASGYRFLKVTTGPNILGGKELIVFTVKDLGSTDPKTRRYKILSASGTSSLQKKLQQAVKEGYEYLDQTELPNFLGGRDVIVILERKEPQE
jgi:hypothetical protein